MTSERVNLLDMSFDELVQRIVAWQQPRFRAAQIWQWLYRSLVADTDEMLNLPKELRARLKEETYVGYLMPVSTLADQEGLTEKTLFEAADGQRFETVLMHYVDRHTVCASSQIGCPVGCVFCATGQQGFVRNLSTGEIIAQILHYTRALRTQGQRLTNVVFMGMGEPLLNYDALWRAILILNDRGGFGLGARRFTISTAGVIPGIERLARESLEVGLAVSLHAPDDHLRNQLVPLNRRYPLAQLIPAVKLYVQRTGRRVTFEYVLADGVNDSEEQAKRTAELLRGLPCHVNLIPLNPTPGCHYASSSHEKALRFQEILNRARIQATLRLGRGLEIQAGCGQLRAQSVKQAPESGRDNPRAC